VLPWKWNSGFPFFCCQAKKYFVLLFTVIRIKYRECVCLYSCLSYPACKSHIFCAVLYFHLWPVRLYYYSSTLSYKQHDFLLKYFEQKIRVSIFSTMFVWNIAHSEKNSADIIINLCRLLCKLLIFLVRL